MWEGSEHSLRISSPYLIQIGNEGVLKIFEQKDHRLTGIIKCLFNNKCVCRTHPATPGLLRKSFYVLVKSINFQHNHRSSLEQPFMINSFSVILSFDYRMNKKLDGVHPVDNRPSPD